MWRIWRRLLGRKKRKEVTKLGCLGCRKVKTYELGDECQPCKKCGGYSSFTFVKGKGSEWWWEKQADLLLPPGPSGNIRQRSEFRIRCLERE